jgi:integrase
LKVGDVYDSDRVVDRVRVAKRNTKKQIESRSVPLHPLAKAVILLWIHDMQDMGKFSPDAPLFPSRKGNKSITRVAAYQRINKAADYVGISTKDIGTHSMRKSFADRVYERSNHNLIQTQQALGHKNVTSTTSYLSFRQEDIDDLILSS